MNLFGIMMELHNQHTDKTDWTAFIYGCIAGIVPWIVIMLYFVGAVSSGDAKPPAFVYAIVPTLFVFFNIFAINMVLQYKKVGPLEGLSLWGTGLHHPESVGQDRAVLADLDRHAGARLERDVWRAYRRADGDAILQRERP